MVFSPPHRLLIFGILATIGVSVFTPASGRSLAIAASAGSPATPAPETTPCAALAMRPGATLMPDGKSKSTVTKAQIAFDLCYLASQMDDIDLLGDPLPAKDAYALESAMQQVVMEGAFLQSCPTPIPAGAVDEQISERDPDYARLHRTGCGPYSKAYDPPAGIAYGHATLQKQCLVARPSPIPPPPHRDTILNTIHPPGPHVVAFDLCRAATVVHVLPAEQIEPYMLNLLYMVHLALTCPLGREGASILYDNATSVPNEQDATYIMTRRYGCPPYPKSLKSK